MPGEGRPLVVQGDGTLLLETAAPGAAAAREALAAFAHLERSPEYVHTYRITPLSLWNAASAGHGAAWIVDVLDRFSRYPVPEVVRREVRERIARFGRAVLLPRDGERLEVRVEDPQALRELEGSQRLAPFLEERFAHGFLCRVGHRGALKQALVKEGWPARDLCGYRQGAPLPLRLWATLRPYQREAVSAFHGGGGPEGGAGVVVLPCGAGKTVVGLGAMERLGTSTLILTTSTVAVRQWRDEILGKTDLPPEAVGEYTGDEKRVRPVTVATYQVLTHRGSRDGDFPHLQVVRGHDWGLIVYDEVHTLPAPVFRVTAEIQVRRRLGLTATLVREDGREDDVFALIGPRIYDRSWRVLEGEGYIAEATCHEIRLGLPEDLQVDYALAAPRDRFRLAAENPRKPQVVEALLREHAGEPVLVIGQYLDQLEALAHRLGRPLITGSTPNGERERLYAAFRRGEERILVVSKVANFAIDLPDAAVAIQVSGTYGSRQEEAQRLGRLLRPKDRPARFYTLVSRDTREQDFAAHRQRFLVEQGYRYQIEDWPDEVGRVAS